MQHTLSYCMRLRHMIWPYADCEHLLTLCMTPQCMRLIPGWQFPLLHSRPSQQLTADTACCVHSSTLRLTPAFHTYIACAALHLAGQVSKW